MKVIVLILFIVVYAIQAMEREENEKEKNPSLPTNGYTQLMNPSLAMSSGELKTKKSGENDKNLLHTSGQRLMRSLAKSDRDITSQDTPAYNHINRLKFKLRTEPLKEHINRMCKPENGSKIPSLMQVDIELFSEKVVNELPSQDYDGLKRIPKSTKTQIKDHLVSHYIKNFIIQCNHFWEESKKTKRTFEGTYDAKAFEHNTFMSSQERYVVTLDKGAVCVWRLDTGKLIKTLKHSNSAIRSTCFSNDDRFIATGDGVGKVIIWPIQKSKKLKPIELNHSYVKNIKEIFFSSHDKMLVTHGEGICTIWDITRQLPLKAISCSVPIHFLFLNDSCNELFTLNKNSIVEARYGHAIKEVGIGSYYSLSPDRRVLASKGLKYIKFIDLNTTIGSPRDDKIILSPCPIRAEENRRTIERISLSAQGRYMTAISSALLSKKDRSDRIISLIDNHTGCIVGNCELDESIHKVQLSSNVRFLTLLKKNKEDEASQDEQEKDETYRGFIEIIPLYDTPTITKIKQLGLKKVILLAAVSATYFKRTSLNLTKRWGRKYKQIPVGIRNIIENKVEIKGK